MGQQGPGSRSKGSNLLRTKNGRRGQVFFVASPGLLRLKTPSPKRVSTKLGGSQPSGFLGFEVFRVFWVLVGLVGVAIYPVLAKPEDPIYPMLAHFCRFWF